MKSLFFDFILSIRKNTLSYILALFLIASLSLLFQTKAALDECSIQKDISGTFSTLPPDSPDDDNEYFVFSDGGFLRYKQFEILDEGSYEKFSDYAYLLKSPETDECITLSNKAFYLYDREKNVVLKFMKFSDTPIFINLKTNDSK